MCSAGTGVGHLGEQASMRCRRVCRGDGASTISSSSDAMSWRTGWIERGLPIAPRCCPAPEAFRVSNEMITLASAEGDQAVLRARTCGGLRVGFAQFRWAAGRLSARREIDESAGKIHRYEVRAHPSRPLLSLLTAQVRRFRDGAGE